MHRGIFLDRDGVINEERGSYTYKVADFVLLPGVQEAIFQLYVAGFLLIVITNQGGIGKGLYSHADVKKCHQHMQKCLGGRITDVLYSPDHPDKMTSLSRKPSPYLFKHAMALHNIGPANSWALGDQVRDIEAAHAVGLQSIGIGKKGHLLGADFHALSLLAATKHIILANTRQGEHTT